MEEVAGTESTPRRQAGVVAEVVHLAALELVTVIYVQVGQKKQIGGHPGLQAAAVHAQVPGRENVGF